VGGAGSVVAGGDDAAHLLGGVTAAAAAHHVQTVGLGALVVAFAGDALLQVRAVGFTAAGHRGVKHRASGVFAEDGVGGVGGGALGRMHGDRVAVP
jgi:hypothetical protein